MYSYLIWTGLALLIIAALLFSYRRMRVPRDPARESTQNAEAVVAYNLVSQWPLFRLQRQIVLHRLLKLNPQGTLLDIGCGPGHLTHLVAQRLPQLTVIGIDNNEHMVKLAKQNWEHSACSNLQFCLGDAHQLPLGDGKVDFVLSSLSLHHWLEPARALKENRRILKPGGQFLFFDLSRDCRRLFYYSLNLGQRILAPAAIRNTNGAVGSFWASYTRGELEALLVRAGFKRRSIKAQLVWMFAWGLKG